MKEKSSWHFPYMKCTKIETKSFEFFPIKCIEQRRQAEISNNGKQ